jgi:hypothetical protein
MGDLGFGMAWGLAESKQSRAISRWPPPSQNDRYLRTASACFTGVFAAIRMDDNNPIYHTADRSLRVGHVESMTPSHGFKDDFYTRQIIVDQRYLTQPCG